MDVKQNDKHNFEQTGGTYSQVGDYMLPDLSLSAEEEKEANIGVWSLRHKRYLNQNHKVFYYNLLTSGKLNSYLVDIEQQAQQLFLRLVKTSPKRKCKRKIQSRQSNALGTENEQYP